MKKKFLVLGIEDCKFCDKAEALGEHRAEVEYHKVPKNLLTSRGFETAPVVFEYIGGYDEMLASILRGENE